MDWIATVLTMVGQVVLIKWKTWFAFVIYLVGNTFWIIYWLGKKEYAALFIVSWFWILNWWGIIKWRRESRS